MRKVVVFGGTGWVGHHVVLDLQKNDYDCIVASRGRKSEDYAVGLGGIRRVVIDKSDAKEMEAFFQNNRIDIVIDMVPTPESIDNVFKFAKHMRRYLHCSSTGGYTPLPFVPCNETALFHGKAGKGWVNKAACDAKVMEMFQTKGFPATVIRPCYITGGSDKLPIDNLGGRREDFIPDMLAQKVLEVADNGLALLQPIHVEDLARSFRLALENPASSIGQCYNICLDHAVTVNEYLAITADAINRKLNVEYVPLSELLIRHPENPFGLKFFAEHMCFSIDKAKKDLNYTPEHGVEETIAETAYLTAQKFK